MLEKTSGVKVPEKNFMEKKELRAFAIAAGGQGMVYSMMSSYISDFYTNILLVSPLFVFILMLAARIWDAVNDPVMGMLADKTKTKWGRMRPYLILTPIPIAILSVLLFLAPDISTTAKMIYASIVYVLWGMIYTISDVPFWSIVNLTTPNPAERGKVISVGRTINGIGAAIPQALMIIIPLIVALFIDESSMSATLFKWKQYRISYLVSAIFVSVIGMALFARFFFYAKERVIPIRKEKVPLKEIYKAMKSNKPLLLVVIAGVLSFTRYMIQAGAIHVARYSFTGTTISQTLLIFGIAVAAGMFGSMLLLPKFFKRFNYKQILITAGLLGFFVDTIMFFVGINMLNSSYILYILVPFLIVSGIPLGVYNVVCFAMIADSIDYMEWKSGYRLDGITSAFQTFINKLGNAFATSFIV
ncbi:MAG: glycoside-pentoside-hexuronide (GPH):cation symporter, partial [Clostridia bacterium]|nr:glycoside-pentoside-hexuronide (GPH):cation symporter [Clostridia bacterium]